MNVFSTDIQPMDQPETVSIFVLKRSFENAEWPPPMTKLSIIDMYLTRNEIQTHAMVLFKVRDSSYISSTYVTRQYTGHS